MEKSGQDPDFQDVTWISPRFASAAHSLTALLPLLLDFWQFPVPEFLLLREPCTLLTSHPFGFPVPELPLTSHPFGFPVPELLLLREPCTPPLPPSSTLCSQSAITVLLSLHSFPLVSLSSGSSSSPTEHSLPRAPTLSCAPGMTLGSGISGQQDQSEPSMSRHKRGRSRQGLGCT